MKKYIKLMIVPVLFQSLLYGQSFDADMYKAIEPSVKLAAQLVRNIENPIVSIDFDSVLNGVVRSVLSGAVHRNIAIKRLKAIETSLENYKRKQYSNYFLSWFTSTPDRVKYQIQPALDKVHAALSILQKPDLSKQIATALAGLIAATGVFVGGVWYADFQRFNRDVNKALAAAYSEVYNGISFATHGKSYEFLRGAVASAYEQADQAALTAARNSDQAALIAARNSDPISRHQAAYDAAKQVFIDALFAAAADAAAADAADENKVRVEKIVAKKAARFEYSGMHHL